jgi:glycosyltransferase involved in cell wall biosynthesis
LTQLKYKVVDWESVALPGFIRTLSHVLRSTDNSILISRTYSIVSLIAAWNCRRDARLWVAHLSDPIPGRGRYPGMKFMSRIKDSMLRFWIRRAFRDADAVSVTCPNVIRFYREEYGSIVDEHPIFVTTHIGDTLLSAPERSLKDSDSGHKIVIHQGQLFYARGVGPLVDAIRQLNALGTSCRFLQVGSVDESCRAKIEKEPFVDIVDNPDPKMAAEYTKQASVVYVPDFQSDRSYSLWLISKFVYTIYEDKPIVVLSAEDSAKHEYAVRFPEAGVFWADQSRPETLIEALKAAFRCVPSQIDRSRIRQEFSAQKITFDFVRNVARIMKQER